MNNKKKMVLGAAFVVAIMALAGIGYAAAFSAYEGKTSSANNTYDIDYIVVKLNEAAYSSVTTLVVTYDTNTTGYAEGAHVVTYDWTGSSAVKHELTYEVPNATTDNFTLTVTPDATQKSAAAAAGFALYYKIGEETQVTKDTVGSWVAFDTTAPSITVNVDSSTTISWALVPTDKTAKPTASGGTVVMPAIEYKVVAAQA